MISTQELRSAILAADPRLSKFNPLSRILFYDDFDEGVNGWTELCGNHDGNLDNVRPMVIDLRPPQLSSCTFFDIGTHGSMEGTYALKLATKPLPNKMSQAIKRVTFVKRGKVQVETYFTYKAEANYGGKPVLGTRQWDGNYHPSEAEFGDFCISNDVHEEDSCYHCALRYMNTDHSGNFVQKWMYKTSLQSTTKMQLNGTAPPPVDYHTRNPEDWEEVPGGYQELCYNEVPTKINWHYLRWIFDLATRRNVELQVNDKIMDLRDVPVPQYPERYWGASRLLNFCFDVRSHTTTRNFLYLDSVLVSVEW
ncbi:MAG: hypothetical protein FJW26_02080 [Acidimicrobiia bacterium]|nr:hypothetical protein [Acidimicrobiia bacterium]